MASSFTLYAALLPQGNNPRLMVATHHLVAQALSAYDDPLQSQGWSFHIFLKILKK